MLLGPAFRKSIMGSRSVSKLQNPYRVHNIYQYPSWLDRFRDEHPPQIKTLCMDLADGKLHITKRPTDDIERLLNSKSYAVIRWD